MTLRTVVRRIAVFGALAAGAIGLCAAAAAAGESEAIETERGSIYFADSGDLLLALDLSSGDGYGVRAYLEWKQNGDSHRADATDIHPSRPRAERNLDIPEGTDVLLKLCYVDAGGQVQKCSPWQDAEA